MGAKEIAEYDQAIKLMSDSFPPLWWSMFTNCKKEGFTDAQAMELVKTFIISFFGGVKN